MTDDDSNIDDLALALALCRLDATSVVPPPDPAREAALMAAFDAARSPAMSARSESKGRDYWAMAALATAAAVLIAVGIAPTRAGRHVSSDGFRAANAPPPSSSRGVQSVQPPSEFVMVPGATALPDMESGSLVRMDLPVSVLPALGVMPPAGAIANVRADLILGQDGLPRAVRLVN